MDENAINAEKKEKQDRKTKQACSIFPQVLNLRLHLGPGLFNLLSPFGNLRSLATFLLNAGARDAQREATPLFSWLIGHVSGC